MNTPAKLQSTAVATRPSALALMAGKLNVDANKLLDTLKATCFRGASNEELLALVVVANTYDLNPLLKEIYAFPAKGGGIVPIIGVDGFIKMMQRQPEFDGLDFETLDDKDGNPYSCTAFVHTKNRSHPVRITEYFDECYRKTDPWDKMPRRMLRNRALCQAARIAFGFSGVKDEDEAIDIIAEVEPMKLPENRELKPSEPKQNKAFKMTLDAPKGDGINISTTQQVPSIHEDFQAFLAENDIPFDLFQRWGEESGNVPDAKSKSSLEEVDGKILLRLFKAKSGLLKGLEMMKPTPIG